MRKCAGRWNHAANQPFLALMPCDVERAEAGIEAEFGIGKVVMNHPPRQGLPALALGVSVRKPRNHDAGRRTTKPFFISDIPDTSCEVAIVTGTAIALPMTYVVDLRRPIGRADSHAPEGVLKWFQQLFA